MLDATGQTFEDVEVARMAGHQPARPKAMQTATLQSVWRSPNRRRCCGVPVIWPAVSRLAVIPFRSEARRSRLTCLTSRNAAYLSTGHHNFRVTQSLGADERK